MDEIQIKLKTYAELKIQEKAISAQLDELKPDIKKYLLDQGVDKLPTSMGNFILTERTTWKYSKAVENLQKEEKANGTAKEVKSVTLMFKETSEENEEK